MPLPLARRAAGMAIAPLVAVIGAPQRLIRAIEIEVKARGARVRARSGYVPD